MEQNTLIKRILFPSVSIILLLGMYAFMGNYLYNQISAVQENISGSQEQQRTLQQKLAILQDTQASVETFTNDVVIALPQANSTLVGVSQVRRLASQSGVTISNLSASAPVKEKDGFKITISFDADAPTELLFGYIDSIKNSAPISTLEKVKIVGTGGTSRASISVAYYWSPLPSTIPSITEGGKEFSREELDILTTLTSLSAPPFSTTTDITNLNQTLGKQDPFSVE